MGTSDFAIPSLEALDKSKHQVVAVVTVPDKRAGRGRKLTPSHINNSAMNFEYPIFQPEDLSNPTFIENIKDCYADLFVVVAFRILPKILFSIPKYGSINMHPSLLPQYRGAAPIQRAIMNGETKTGITTFQISKKVDAGNILLQKEYPISINDTTGNLWKRFSVEGAKMIVETLDRIEAKEISEIIQITNTSLKAPKIQKEDCQIDWKDNATVIHNKIRALDPKPGAYTLLNGNKVKLFQSISLTNNNFKEELQLKPGEIKCYNEHLLIGTGDGIVKIEEIQFEGKRRLTLREFLLGYSKIGGETFDNK
ncbi:MAG: methionyl-tRNA formyltransferase [Candidatus Marinimicrobia bacterium]|nr:methionyl-tRNA formyltransferase [Candidatus Neomarinimicrobiota bacterium]MBL7109692.1 methionyl-tRNA formyltransferase [Candidatus Neomarinimicrobiota bacterium]